MPVEWTKASKYRTESSSRRREAGVGATLEHRIGELASAAHGVVSLDQLRGLGLSASAVRSRVAQGRLHQVHRGVFAVGHAPLTREGHLMAAVLASGPEAVLSHRSAASLHGLLADNRARVDVTAARRRGRAIRGIEAHACELAPEEKTVVDRIPSTSVGRTLLDLAGTAGERALRSALRKAEILRVLDLREVEAAADRVSRPRGVVMLRRVIEEFDPEVLHAESELEAEFLDLCRGAGLPMPEVNVPLEVDFVSIRADCLWRAERLVVELDSNRFHSTPSGVERDKRRDQRLLLAGWQTMRVTSSQVRREPDALAATLDELLKRRRLG